MIKIANCWEKWDRSFHYKHITQWKMQWLGNQMGDSRHLLPQASPRHWTWVLTCCYFLPSFRVVCDAVVTAAITDKWDSWVSCDLWESTEGPYVGSLLSSVAVWQVVRLVGVLLWKRVTKGWKLDTAGTHEWDKLKSLSSSPLLEDLRVSGLKVQEGRLDGPLVRRQGNWIHDFTTVEHRGEI